MFTEEELLPLSALRHLSVCERQCGLIHIEQVWVENLFTAQGRIMHERVDQTGFHSPALSERPLSSFCTSSL